MSKSIFLTAEEIHALQNGSTLIVRPLRVYWKGRTKCAPYEPYYCEEGGQLFCSDECGEWGRIEDCEFPYGMTGELLLIKESWMELWGTGRGVLTCLTPTEKIPDNLRIAVYRADGEKPVNFAEKWMSPATMPKWAVRYKPKIVSITAKRVCDLDRIVIDKIGLCEARLKSRFKKVSWSDTTWVWLIEHEGIK